MKRKQTPFYLVFMNVRPDIKGDSLCVSQEMNGDTFCAYQCDDLKEIERVVDWPIDDDVFYVLQVTIDYDNMSPTDDYAMFDIFCGGTDFIENPEVIYLKVHSMFEWTQVAQNNFKNVPIKKEKKNAKR